MRPKNLSLASFSFHTICIIQFNPCHVIRSYTNILRGSYKELGLLLVSETYPCDITFVCHGGRKEEKIIPSFVALISNEDVAEPHLSDIGSEPNLARSDMAN